jgi:hypothetical protein
VLGELSAWSTPRAAGTGSSLKGVRTAALLTGTLGAPAGGKQRQKTIGVPYAGEQ